MHQASCHVFVASSLDGFIAGPDDELDWLEDPRFFIDGEDFGYGAFLEEMDIIVMGRRTFEKVASFETWPYEGIKVVVLSHTISDLPERFDSLVEYTHLTPQELVLELSRRGAKKLYIDGGKTIQSFLKEHLIQELIITTIPIILGEGKPLFDNLGMRSFWHLKANTKYPNSMMQSRYTWLRE